MIRTAGGRFNPGDRPIFFLAGGGQLAAYGQGEARTLLIALDQLMSDSAVDGLDSLLDADYRIMLDSGAFGLTADYARKTGMDRADAFRIPPEVIPGFEDLRRRYVEIVRPRQDRLWGYTELDLGGTDGKRRLRARMHDEGLSPMPVYHPLWDGWDYFDELASEYDRIAHGNLAGASHTIRKRLVYTAWERHRAYPDLWLHLLGFTPNTWLHAAPCDSVDSSSWAAGLRWVGGQVIVGGMMRNLGDLPNDFRYAGHGEDDVASHPKALRFLSGNAAGLDRTWRLLSNAQTTRQGGEPYPPREPDEPPLRSR